MNKKQKATRIIIIAGLLAMVITAFIWRFVWAAPRKPGPIPTGDYSYTIDYAEHRLEKFMKQHHLPSLGAILIDDQQVIWQAVYGSANLEQGIPAAPDTVYKVWSLAKVFTAIETMRLVEEGKLDLDAPIQAYLPDFSIQSRFPDSGPVTVRSLLTHRSGLPRNECHRIDYHPDAIGELVASIQDCYQVSPVGERYKYSNIAIDLLGYLIEVQRGGLFPDIMLNNLLQPLGMENSTFARANLPQDRVVATGYEYYEGDYYPMEQVDITSFPSSNLYTTIEDMGVFLKFIFRGGEVNGEQIIKQGTLNAMFLTQPTHPDDPQSMGLGWKTAQVLGGEQLVWHDGGPGEGVGGLIATLPERKVGVVLFANSTAFEGSQVLPLAIDLLEPMLETKYGISPPPGIKKEPVPLDPAALQAYPGKYIIFGEVIEVTPKRGKLKVGVLGMNFTLEPIGQATFRLRHWLIDLGLLNLLPVPMDLRQLEIRFVMGEESGGNDRLIINFGGLNYETCPRYPDVDEVPPLWEDLSGEYDLKARLPSGAVGKDVLGGTSIWVEEGVLRMAGYVGPMLPISETEIIILSGSFQGETFHYDPDTGYLTHQMIVYTPR